MAEPTDSDFYAVFKDGMATMRLPCPESLFGSLSTATATIGTLASAVKTFGTNTTVRELLLAFPTGAAAAGVSAAIAEICAAVGACAAAFYLGAAVGCLLGAAVQVYGLPALGQLAGFLRSLVPKLGPIDKLIEGAYRKWPGYARLQTSANYARTLGAGGSGSRGAAYA